MVTVLYGANGGPIDGLAGKTVGAVRSAYSSLFEIPPASEAAAQLNGASASEADVLRDGDELQFVKTVARKG